MPQHYPSTITYQATKRFTPISKRNINDMLVLGEEDTFVYLVNNEQTAGFVFLITDLKQDVQHVVPVMRLSLRDTQIKDYKQAHALRIQESYSKMNVTSTWYKLFVDQFGGIVSDAEHLEGGKQLWLSFIKDTSRSVTLWDTQTLSPLQKVTPETSHNVIWSQDTTLKSKVLVYERN